ncbi:restriction endonuclease [Vreelandella boliviensis]|uniref:restriction endonuclease n=1 Tax=Vreelandella boliviensis TaxID=223527 RepID=UPI001B8C8826|nr:restriction endonuclease [Halomonas boliviensis]MBS3667474.1 restriction endonuclease [Halomonas boliviensis]
MKDFRVDKLNNITKEVDEFHPLLRILFEKLNGVSSVEYKQGNREMGADFVITKEDATLGGDEYIGVIVKVGSISQSNSEVERQIDECQLERTIQGGKKKVFLSEIWVVVSGRITQNAQDKIHHKFKNQKIKFIQQENLLRLIDQHYPDYWSNVPIEEGVYLERVRAF